MISICIPVFNYDVTPLVIELEKQMSNLAIETELIVIDDGSDYNKSTNAFICKKHKYVELQQNIGRSKIRNLFLLYANFDYLLFLDCDSLIDNPSFLRNYVEYLKTNPNVVCGGRKYPLFRPKKEFLLRWKYGILRESKPFEKRQLEPNKSFMTNNFIIKKSILEKIKFDEQITRYGHEDTLFGYALKLNQIQISHINNPILNGHLENNLDYLQKTEESIINLLDIINYTHLTHELIDDINLLRFFKKIKHFESCISHLYYPLKTIFRLLLNNGIVSIHLFDLYKLTYFSMALKERKNSIVYKKIHVI